jgi:hypothetical protein
MSEEPLANKSWPSSAMPEAEYDLIHATLSETAQGRRFLEEHARRCHPSETRAGLAAIERMQAVIREGGTSERLQILLEMVDMAQAIVHLRTEILAMRPPGGGPLEATEELDSIVQTTENATARILAAAEQVQEIAWTMRETGSVEALCDELDARATDIYTACSFQDLTGQRTRKVIQVLRYLEDRLKALVGGQERAPAREEAGASNLLQAGVDAVMRADAAIQEGRTQDRQDATLEEISRRMLAMEPAIGLPTPAGEETTAKGSATEEVRPELSVAETVMAEEQATQKLMDWDVHPAAAAAAQPPAQIAEMVDWVVEHPQDPQPDAEPAWMILRRMENELAVPAEPVAEAEPDVSMPWPLPSPPAQPAPPSPVAEPALVVAETVSQLAEELRPSSVLPAPELARTKLSTGDPRTISPVRQPQTESPSALMRRAAAMVSTPRVAAAGAYEKPAETDPDDFLFAPEETSAALPLRQQAEQPSPATPESQPDPDADAESPKNSDPLSPLRAMSDAQKIALFS